MKTSKLYKLLYLIPFPMFAVSFILNIMCFRRETLGFYIHKRDKENSKRCLRQIHLGETEQEYNKMYDDLVNFDKENYVDISKDNYLGSAKASTK